MYPLFSETPMSRSPPGRPRRPEAMRQTSRLAWLRLQTEGAQPPSLGFRVNGLGFRV